MKILGSYGIVNYIGKFLHLIRRLVDINVQACACDSLYHTITKCSFLLFQSDGLYSTVKLSAALSI